CSGCKTTKPAVAFGTKGNGTRTKTCLVCLRADAVGEAETEGFWKQRILETKRMPPPDFDAEEDAGRGLGILSLHDFLDTLTQEDDNLKLEARVDISSIS
ncbi:hypothetical protein B0H14DRAFT_2172215, partial [Mycena olivaceomarginata]